MEEEKKDKGFVIKDRRLFDESGAARVEEEIKPEDKKRTEKPEEEPRTSPTEMDTPETEASPLPEINFASFIFSLSTTAMYHFGDFPDPVTKESQRNLPAAKQTIDILSILKTKTEGNLDEQEKQMLDGILYELRMRFIKEMTNK
ncbi:MAG: DUF1844 domain-containing protein [Syntrophales bacterium]|nr:DUF1844 domain-containing protein [Syntrophales bacterium]MDP3098519.1 DUF1844 domain-containing protein [Syntrophales bacterium]